MKQKKIAVIGGGASGMMAAITAAKRGAFVTVYEGNDRVGKKILATGNGKCNFSNRCMGVEHFYTSKPDLVGKVLSEFSVQDTEKFFEGLGMLIRDRDGYLYPASEQASTVLDVLRMEMERLDIRVITEAKVKTVCLIKPQCFLVVNEKQEEIYDAVIIACGSKASPKTGSDGSGYKLVKTLGHKVSEVVPALVQLRVEENLKPVSGVRAQAKVRLFIDGEEVASENGELQLTDFGVSGIVVFQLSRIAAYALSEKKKVEISVDFLREYDREPYEDLIKQRMERLKDRTVEQFFTGILNKKLMQFFIKQAGLNFDTPIAKAEKARIQKVFELCRNWTVHVKETNSFDSAQVCAGGVLLSEVTPQMESKIHPGLYFAGEILDVDGKCGGYNLQWAWSSGHAAGWNAAK